MSDDDGHAVAAYEETIRDMKQRDLEAEHLRLMGLVVANYREMLPESAIKHLTGHIVGAAELLDELMGEL